jgi:DNA-binding MarR family transcriptional regulator
MSRKDEVDRFLELALDLFPMLDPQVEAAVDRMTHLVKHLDRTTERNVARFGLNTGEFRLLLKLRQTPAERASAGELAARLKLSSGAMTNRLDRLEEAGLIVRERDARDRRSVTVTLTPSGVETLAKAVDAQADEEKRIMSVLTSSQLDSLNDLLRSVLLGVEDDRAKDA